MNHKGDVKKPIREVKICFLGDEGVGKTSLAHRYVYGTFDQGLTTTIGAKMLATSVLIGDETITCHLWDTAGEEKYRSVAPMYYRGAAAAIIVYDVTSEDSFDCMKSWVKELTQFGPKDVIIAVVGNKCDLKEKTEVSTEAGRDYAESVDAIFLETSAKTARNVNKMFAEIGQALSLKPSCHPSETLPKEPLSKNTSKKPKGSCC